MLINSLNQLFFNLINNKSVVNFHCILELQNFFKLFFLPVNTEFMCHACFMRVNNLPTFRFNYNIKGRY